MNKPLILAYRSFCTPMNTIEKFSKAGYETICVFPAHTLNSRGTPYCDYPPVWRWYDKLDYHVFDEMIADISRAVAYPASSASRADPDSGNGEEAEKKEAKFLLMIDLNSPVWLEHMNCYSCSDTFNNLGKAIHNPEWVKPTMTFLEAFVRYAKEKYGDRIVAYIPACGATDEWYDYSNGTEDSSRRAAWRVWQQKQGRPDPVDIPPESVREHVSHEDFLRNPHSDGLAIQYWQFVNDSVADMIVKCADVIRSIVGEEAQIGCFYGYILEKTYRTLVSCGHLAYEKVLDCENIDFVISPGTYTDRQMGGGSGFLVPSGTAAVRGKHLLHECDQRTHTYNSYLTPYINLRLDSAWPDEKSTVAGIKREAALGLIKRTHLWWFDQWGDFYQGEAVMNTLTRVRELWEEYSHAPARDVCEVAMIVDPDSTYMVNENHPMAAEMNLNIRNKLNRLGAPYEVYSFMDLPKIKDFDRYKLVIFTSMFRMTGEKKKILDDCVLRGGRSVVWLYAPGIADENSFDTENCARLTGAGYGTEGMTLTDMGEWKSYYLYRYTDLTVEAMKTLAKDAGVQMTVEDAVPVYAEGYFLAVHTAQGGEKTVCVDKRYAFAEELFTGRTAEIKDGKFVYPFMEPDTALFVLKE